MCLFLYPIYLFFLRNAKGKVSLSSEKIGISLTVEVIAKLKNTAPQTLRRGDYLELLLIKSIPYKSPFGGFRGRVAGKNNFAITSILNQFITSPHSEDLRVELEEKIVLHGSVVTK
jgi:hypothetical protein